VSSFEASAKMRRSKAQTYERGPMWLQWLPKVYQWVQEHGGEPIIPFSGIMESKLFDMPDDEKGVYCKEVRCLLGCPDFVPPVLQCLCK
jgi:hypothetical protein